MYLLRAHYMELVRRVRALPYLYPVNCRITPTPSTCPLLFHSLSSQTSAKLPRPALFQYCDRATKR